MLRIEIIGEYRHLIFLYRTNGVRLVVVIYVPLFFIIICTGEGK